MSDYCEIYEISVTIDGKLHNKFYIGQTWTGSNVRFSKHKSDKSGDCPKLFNAMNKYGRENFSIRTIFTVKTQEDADFYENYFINEYDSINNGYNIREGGSTGKMSEESKRKISEANMGHFVSEKTKLAVILAHKGIPLSEEHKAKISEKIKGENHPLWGKHQSEESKLKNSESNKKIYLSIEEGGKGYIHPSTGKTFGPLSEETKNKLSEINSGENNGFYGKKHTEETKALLSELNKGKSAWNKGRKATDEERKKMSENHHMLGKNHSEETKIKISKSGKGKNTGENNGMFGKTGTANPFFGKKHSPETIEKIKIKSAITKANKKLAKQMKQFYASTIYYNLDI